MIFETLITFPISGKNVSVINMNEVNHLLGMLRGEDRDNSVAKVFSTCIIRRFFSGYQYGITYAPSQLRKYINDYGVEGVVNNLLDYIKNAGSDHYAFHTRAAFIQMRELCTEKKDINFISLLVGLWQLVENYTLSIEDEDVSRIRLTNILEDLYKFLIKERINDDI